jgi:hypothetical protein
MTSGTLPNRVTLNVVPPIPELHRGQRAQVIDAKTRPTLTRYLGAIGRITTDHNGDHALDIDGPGATPLPIDQPHRPWTDRTVIVQPL